MSPLRQMVVGGPVQYLVAGYSELPGSSVIAHSIDTNAPMHQKSFIPMPLSSAHNAIPVVSVGAVSHLYFAACQLSVGAMNSFRHLCWFMWLHRGALRRKLWHWRVASVRIWGATYYSATNQHELYLLQTKTQAQSCA